MWKIQLSYAAGSPIPIVVTFSSDDQQALDLICSPTAVKVALVRERLIGLVATRPGTGSSANVVREVMATANFWPSENGGAPPHPLRRVLHGELDVRKTFRPTFVFPSFSLRVSNDTRCHKGRSVLTVKGTVLSAMIV